MLCEGVVSLSKQWVGKFTLNSHPPAVDPQSVWNQLCHCCISGSFQWDYPGRQLRARWETQHGGQVKLHLLQSLIQHTKQSKSTLTLFLKTYPAIAAAISTMMTSDIRTANWGRKRNLRYLSDLHEPNHYFIQSYIIHVSHTLFIQVNSTVMLLSGLRDTTRCELPWWPCSSSLSRHHSSRRRRWRKSPRRFRWGQWELLRLKHHESWRCCAKPFEPGFPRQSMLGHITAEKRGGFVQGGICGIIAALLMYYKHFSFVWAYSGNVLFDYLVTQWK